MTRLIHLVSQFFDIFGAARGAAAASRDHRMPSSQELAVLGISESQFRQIRL